MTERNITIAEPSGFLCDTPRMRARSLGRERVIARMMASERKFAIGRYVEILVGKWRGRAAKIDGVIWGHRGFLYCCMVLRKDGQGWLNSDGETRRYRPRSDFAEIERMDRIATASGKRP